MEGKPGFKECPFCAEWIRERAIYCRFCRQMLPAEKSTSITPGTLQDSQSHALANLTRLAPKGLRELLLDDFEVASEAERRVITIMFADICGYTALSEDRDPEYVRELINRCFETMAGAVDRYGGMVVHFLGDAVLAAFGVPRAHEDDPERAVRAALQMIEGVAKIGRSEKLDLGLSVGIHSGEVVVGGISVGDRLDFTAFGDAVNTTSRLQNLAGFGEILISQKICQQVHHAFDLESRPPAFVKNKREPIVNFKVLGLKRQPARQRPRGHGEPTPLIGREKELAAAEKVVRALDKERPGFLCIVGEPGVGKSRLSRELRGRIGDQKTLWIEAGCVSFGSAIPYGPVLDLLREALGVEEGDSSPRIAEQIRKKTNGLKGVRKRTRDALAYLLGNTASDNPVSQLDAKRRKKLLIAESIAFFKGLAARRPVVLLLDDLHWADALSIEWLDALVASLEKLPILVIALYRPVFRHAWPKISQPATINLKELSTAESRRLLYELLGVSKMPAQIVKEILRRTRGNPFFLEELIHAFVDAGILKKRGSQWEFVRDVDASEVPDTLRSVILARIDSLEVRLRRVLQCASVIGRGFRYRMLEYITDFQTKLDDYVHQLVDVHFLLEQALLQELLYIFRHAVARDVTYDTLLKKRRADFHRRVGEYIESMNADHLERHYEFLAHHYYLSDAPQKAAYYLERAAEKFERLYANEAVIDTSNKLIEVIDKRLPKSAQYRRMRVEALIRMGRVQKLLVEYEASAKSYESAIRIADRLKGGSDLAAMARRNVADVDRLTGRHNRALRRLDRAEKIWARLGDNSRRLTAHNSKGAILMTQGKYVQAARELDRGVKLARQAGTREALANVLNDLGIARLHSGLYRKALDAFGEALGLMEEIGDKKGITAALNNIGMCHERLGQFEDALNHYGRSFEMAEKIGHRFGLLAGLVNIGQCYQYQGDHKSAIRQFRRVIRMTEKQPQATARSLALGNLATNLVWLGRYADAVDKIREARHWAAESDAHFARVNADLADSLRMIRRGEPTQAIPLLRRTIADIERRDYFDYRSLAYGYLAEALLYACRPVEARRAADRALKAAEKSGNPRDLAWALRMRAWVDRECGNGKAARAMARKAARLAAKIGDTTLLNLLKTES